MPVSLQRIRVTIYTDFHYTFGICHAIDMLWLQRGFLISAGKCIANANLITELLSAKHLPKAIAVIHCSAHTDGTDPVSRGVKGNSWFSFSSH